MSTDPLHFQTLTELARQVHSGALSPVTLTEALLARIAALDKKLGAFRLVMPERALAQARAAEVALRSGTDLGPLHGLPFAAKDLFDVQGYPTTAGTRLLADSVAKQDGTVIRSLQRAGMVLLGKVNTVQFAANPLGINHDHGTPHNPWYEVLHTPGGSSSGSGVAVAAGLAPMALGTDTGGSVRLPAALCGTVGLKTTVGRISRAGVYPLSHTLDSIGPLTRSVEDAALVFQHLAGEDAADESTLGVPAIDVLRHLKAGVRGTRLAIAETIFFDHADPEVASAVNEAAKVLAGLGANVQRIAFPEAAEALKIRSGMITAVEGYAHNRELLENHLAELDPAVTRFLMLGKPISAADYYDSRRKMAALRHQAHEVLSEIDALLVPTLPVPAQPVSEVDATAEEYMRRFFQFSLSTAIGNILNFCGLSVPCGFTRKGLPIGLMIYGKAFAEDTILRVGHAYEQATPWHARHPDLAWAG